MQKEQNDTASIEVIHRRIMGIRGDRVMLDLHLAALYGVETRQLKRAVRRNIHRFPPDFMFELTREEYNSLRSQIGTIKRGEHSKYLPMAFTEQGVAMLSSVLNSRRAIEVNILIMRAFVRLRGMMASQKEVARKLAELEKHLQDHDEQIQAIFTAIRQLMTAPEKPSKKIGFQLREKRAAYGRREELPKQSLAKGLCHAKTPRPPRKDLK